MKNIALTTVAVFLTGCASPAPQTKLTLDRGYRIERPIAQNDDGRIPTWGEYWSPVAMGGDKNDPGGYEGSGGTGDSGGRSLDKFRR